MSEHAGGFPGVRARSRRGQFGSTWWSRQLVEVMERLVDGGRLARGRSYARGGRVLSLEVVPGMVRGEVQGSQLEPFRAMFTMRKFDAYELAELRDEVTRTPGMLAALASGTVPNELGGLLLPTDAQDLDFDCSCPDFGWPCKHAAALTYLTAERLDVSPADILTLRGVDLESLISEVGDRGDDLTDFYGDELTLPTLPRVAPRAATEDLDPMLLRSVLRAAGGGVREGEQELAGLYRRLMWD
ncbi:SWIM zinc finger family protein [Speluncibacter jeojiensis]|uniref:SWIM zinc finger family protein n=1 Tax=Speluncibacter jeojiensis TaxID=2710754 RepID=A0A9X4M682_9ACTN|nr:SWIM zinc finger family protein [Corynebacteriales bacterium D3-21]